MTKAAVGVRVKPEDEASKSSPNFLPGGGVRGERGGSGGGGTKTPGGGAETPALLYAPAA